MYTKNLFSKFVFSKTEHLMRKRINLYFFLILSTKKITYNVFNYKIFVQIHKNFLGGTSKRNDKEKKNEKLD